jgi:hypothetical protein
MIKLHTEMLRPHIEEKLIMTATASTGPVTGDCTFIAYNSIISKAFGAGAVVANSRRGPEALGRRFLHSSLHKYSIEGLLPHLGLFWK